jgi:CubicO group peptidase (beta-lactamase class C family)
MALRLHLAFLTVIALSACASKAVAEPVEPPRPGTQFSAEDEAVYAARFARLMEDMKVRSGLTAYDPLDIVPGASRLTPLPVADASPFSPAALEQAALYAGKRNSSALVVMRQGQIAFERYFDENTRDTLINAQSMAKPMTALAIGRAIRLGHIRSLDQPVAEIITEWQGDPIRSQILIRHLLDMRSGLLPQGFSPDPADVLNRAYLHPRHDEVIIRDYPATHEPGSRYEYSNANAELIAPIIERATGQRYADFLGAALLAPLGAPGGSVWVNRPGGTAHSGCCLLLPVESWLKLGMLLMQDGVWEGERLLPEGYTAEMLTPTAQNPYYGLGVYVAGTYIERRGFANPAIAYGKVLHSEPYVDKDIFLFDGNGNQVMYMVPSQQMIILRTGGSPPKDAEWDNSFLPNLLIRDGMAQSNGTMLTPQPR